MRAQAEKKIPPPPHTSKDTQTMSEAFKQHLEKRAVVFDGHWCLIAFFKDLTPFERALINGTPSADIVRREFDAANEWATYEDTLEIGACDALRAEKFAQVDRVTRRFREDYARRVAAAGDADTPTPDARVAERRREEDEAHLQCMRALYKQQPMSVRRMIHVYNKEQRQDRRRRKARVNLAHMADVERVLFLCDRRDVSAWRACREACEHWTRERSVRDDLQRSSAVISAASTSTPRAALPDPRNVRMRERKALSERRAARTAARRAPKRKRGESDDEAEALVSSADLLGALCAGVSDMSADDAQKLFSDREALDAIRAAAEREHALRENRYLPFKPGAGKTDVMLAMMSSDEVQTMVALRDALSRTVLAEIHMRLLKKHVRKQLSTETLERIESEWRSKADVLHKYGKRLRHRQEMLLARHQLTADFPRRRKRAKAAVAAEASASASTPTSAVTLLLLPESAKKYISGVNETFLKEKHDDDEERALADDYANPVSVFNITELGPHVVGRRWQHGNAIEETDFLVVYDSSRNTWHVASDFDDDELERMPWLCDHETLPARAKRDRTQPVEELRRTTHIYADDDDE